MTPFKTASNNTHNRKKKKRKNKRTKTSFHTLEPMTSNRIFLRHFSSASLDTAPFAKAGGKEEKVH